mmetsp:Transcript_76077/g.213301  ORF Transcript_76077/g.213301 Transcript_76077/m.213301 type:complete len:236 (-) Transcript_76077:737-1444(-)
MSCCNAHILHNHNCSTNLPCLAPASSKRSRTLAFLPLNWTSSSVSLEMRLKMSKAVRCKVKSKLAMCFVDKPSFSMANPDTNSSIVSSPVLFTSKVSHAFIMSSVVRADMEDRIILMTASVRMSDSNSSRSSSPLPSASASRNALRRKSKNFFCICCSSFCMASSRPIALSTTLSEATAVKIDIIVHDAAQINNTKKPCQRMSTMIAGLAMSIQLSSVVTWNKENMVVGMSLKCT